MTTTENKWRSCGYTITLAAIEAAVHEMNENMINNNTINRKEENK